MAIKVGLLESFAKDHFLKCFNMGITDLPLGVIGAPGCGKTEIMAGIAPWLSVQLKEEVDAVILHPSTHSDVDYLGHPAVIDGEAEHLLYGMMRNLFEATKKTIVIFDDLGQAKPSVQAPVMQIIRQREINGRKLPDCVLFAFCSNGAADKAGVAGLLRPLQDRVILINVEPDPVVLSTWIKDHYPESAVVSQFVLYRPEHVMLSLLDADQKANKIGVGYPSHRSFTMLARTIPFNYSGEVWREIVEGMIGKPAAVEFIGYEKIWKGLVPYAEVLANPAGAAIPGQSDGKYAQIGSLLHRAKRSEFKAVWQYISRFPAEFLGYAGGVIDKVRKDLTETAEYQNWRASRNY